MHRAGTPDPTRNTVVLGAGPSLGSRGGDGRPATEGWARGTRSSRLGEWVPARATGTQRPWRMALGDGGEGLGGLPGGCVSAGPSCTRKKVGAHESTAVLKQEGGWSLSSRATCCAGRVVVCPRLGAGEIGSRVAAWWPCMSVVSLVADLLTTGPPCPGPWLGLLVWLGLPLMRKARWTHLLWGPPVDRPGHRGAEHLAQRILWHLTVAVHPTGRGPHAPACLGSPHACTRGPSSCP